MKRLPGGLNSCRRRGRLSGEQYGMGGRRLHNGDCGVVCVDVANWEGGRKLELRELRKLESWKKWGDMMENSRIGRRIRQFSMAVRPVYPVSLALHCFHGPSLLCAHSAHRHYIENRRRRFREARLTVRFLALLSGYSWGVFGAADPFIEAISGGRETERRLFPNPKTLDPNPAGLQILINFS